jgi:hypothetical protein
MAYGVLYGTLGQIMSFMQLQASIKYGWHNKFLIVILLFGIPNIWLYIQSVESFMKAFNGTMWESRILGFCIGVTVFAVMGHLMFSENLSAKTVVSLLLAFCVVLIQVLWK